MRGGIAGAGLLAGLLVGAVAPAAARDGGPPVGVLILPFDNVTEDRPLAWLSTGLALHTGEHLRARGAAVVDDEERSVFLEGNGIPSGASLTLASALELGRKMRARPGGVRPDRIVVGRFSVQEGSIALSARVIDLEGESGHPWITRQGRLTDLLDVHAALSEALAKDTGLSRGARRDMDPEPPLLAFETYSRAMAETDVRKRLAMLRRALQEAPGYPAASYQAAAVLVRTERWNDAAEILKGSASDAPPYEAEFHLLQAGVALQRHDPAAAAEAARRSLGLAETARGHAVLGRAEALSGDVEAGHAELDKATALDASDVEVDELRRLLVTLKQDPQAPGRTP